MRPPNLVMFALVACGDPEPVETIDLTCDGAGDELVLLARSIRFARLDAPGVAAGFDLDGRVSDDRDEVGCGVVDLVDVDGRTGIDNAMAALMPVLDTTEASAIEPLMQDSINGGALLMMASITDLDDLYDDECVDVSVFKGVGLPMIGADGWLLPNQTLRVDASSLGNVALANELRDGVLEAGPIPLVALPIQVLDLNTTMQFFDVRLRVTEREDGVWVGYLGGGIGVQQLIDTATLGNVDPNLYSIIAPVLARLADLAPDATGTCQQISVTLEVEMVPAFTFDEG